jgi:glycosyltransferase involved in cell wall biosynthesis
MKVSSSGLHTVVHVAGQLEYGGLEKLLVEFARRVDRKRFRLHFVSLTSRGPVAGDLESHGWPVTALELGDGLHPRGIFQLRNLFRKAKAAVVHTHNTRALLYGGLAARFARVKRLVHTRHGQAMGKSNQNWWIRRFGSQMPDWIVCVSRDAKRIAAAEGIPASRLRSIWNGIDPDRFTPATPGQVHPVISVGRLTPEKDYGTLIRAAGLVARDAPEYRLTIAGGGPCEVELRELINSLGLTRTVTLLGPVGDVPSLMASGSMFALSSLTEGISLTILEAMAAGLPVVATSVGGNPEVIKHGATGVLVLPGEPHALAASLLTLWRDPDRRIEYGMAGRHRVREFFDVRGTVAEYELLYG